MRISIIIPSRLQVNHGDPAGGLWLRRALASVNAQVALEGHELEVVVGLDPGAVPPDGFAHVHFVHGRVPSQAAAVNAAVRKATGECLAFLEDDDAWTPKRLAYGLQCIGDFDLVSANQWEQDEQGVLVGINDFATPSGWFLRRATWDRLGPFDETLRFHVDTDFLGRVNVAGLRRLHLVEREAPVRPWIQRVARYSKIGRTEEPAPLVIRTANPHGGMGLIASDPAARRQSDEEHEGFRRKYGHIPW